MLQPLVLPAGLSDTEGEIWRELLGHLPENTILARDGYAFATLVRLLARERRAPDKFTAGEHAILLRYLGKFCLTPLDRYRMPPGPRPAPEDDPAAKYFTG